MEPVTQTIGAASAALSGSGALATAMKVAPVLFTAGSLMTPNKTMKDIFGLGALATSGLGLLGGSGGGAKSVIDAAGKASPVGAAVPAAGGTNLKSIIDAAAGASPVGASVTPDRLSSMLGNLGGLDLTKTVGAVGGASALGRMIAGPGASPAVAAPAHPTSVGPTLSQVMGKGQVGGVPVAPSAQLAAELMRRRGWQWNR